MECTRPTPLSNSTSRARNSFSDSVNGTRFNFEWDSANRSITDYRYRGQEVAGIQGFWFAWFAFHPDTEVFKAASGDITLRLRFTIFLLSWD